MKKILEVFNLTKKYGSLLAVDNLSFTVQKGKVYGLLGPNGSGKSTTLGMILNVVNKTSGSIQWFEGKLTTSQALKKTGAIIERPNFYPYMTARQNLELVCKIKEIDTESISQKLDLVDLLDRQHDKFKTFSLGMKQRLAIASALLNDPDLLILDEPTNGLDPKGIHEIRRIITDIAQTGKTIILASHLLDEVEKVCNNVIILQKGKKIFEGEVTELNSQFAWFEITAPDLMKTRTLLLKLPFVEKITEEDEMIKLYVNTEIKGNELNRYLAENNVFVDSLIKKQSSLESSFLQITD